MIHTVLSVIQGFVAVAFLVAGGTKCVKTRAIPLDDPRMGWATDFSSSQIRLIAFTEVLGAIALVIPFVFASLPVVTALVAFGLSALMAGAAFTHVRRHESAATPVVLGLLIAVVAVGRLIA